RDAGVYGASEDRRRRVGVASRCLRRRRRFFSPCLRSCEPATWFAGRTGSHPGSEALTQTITRAKSRSVDGLSHRSAPSSVIECAYSVIPVVQDVHHSMHADEFENRADPSGYLKQLQVPALCVQFPEAREKGTESRTVDKAQPAQIQGNLGVRLQNRCDIPLEFRAITGVEFVDRQNYDGDIARSLDG